MVFGYGRVSTYKQLSGNSIEDQTERLTEAGAEKIFIDCFTGAEKDRPELNKMLSEIKAGDSVLVTKLDRLARSAKDGLDLIDQIMNVGASITVLNMGTFNDTAIGRLTRTILLAFSEYERDAIIERMTTGKDIARANGVRVDGRPPKFTDKQRNHALDLLDNGICYHEVERMTGISKSTLIRAMNKRKAERLKAGVER